MRSLRALVFNALFYSWLIVYLIWCCVFFPFPRRIGFAAVKRLMWQEIALQRLFGMSVEIRGMENIPQGGFIVAAKHQSMWETFALLPLFDDVTFIYKKELGRVPFFGWYLRKFDQIAVDRKGGHKAMRQMNNDARQAIAENRQILIFPEGTRRPAGGEPQYKFGIAALYNTINAPVVPVALNSGMFWGKYFWRGDIGRIIVDILPPIPAGLPRDEFFALVQQRIEDGCDAQMLEVADGPNPPPLSPIAQARVDELRSRKAAPAPTANPQSA